MAQRAPLGSRAKRVTTTERIAALPADLRSNLGAPWDDPEDMVHDLEGAERLAEDRERQEMRANAEWLACA